MNTSRLIGIILALVIFSLAGHRVQAQTPDEKMTPEQKQKLHYESQKQELELKARKQMLEQQQMEQEMKMKQIEIEFAERAEAMEDMRERERTRVYVRSSGENEPIYLPAMYGHGNQTQLTLRNSFRGGSDSSKGKFDVDESTGYIRCMINGKVTSGSIIIFIEYPDGTVFKKLTINSSAEISYNQSLTIKEGEEDKYIGAWGYEVHVRKAEGNYMLQVSTN
jgi:hypothetical protein